MPRGATEKSWYRLWDRAALAGLAATLFVGVGLGGSGSSTVRAVVQLLALLACGLLATAMIADGRWRLVGSPLWIIPIGLGGWAFLHTVMGGPIGRLRPELGIAIESPGIAWNRYGALQWICFAAAITFVTIGTAHGLRSLGRMKALAGVLAGVLLMLGGAAGLQLLVDDSKWLGLYSVDDHKLSVWARDWIGTETSLGLRSQSMRNWTTADEAASDGKNTGADWFLPAPRTAAFGTFASVADWSAAASLAAPFALAAGFVYLQRRRRGASTAWDVDGPRGWTFIAAAFLLGVGPAVLGDPIASILACLCSVLVMSAMADPIDRSTIRKVGLLFVTFLILTAGVAIAASNGLGRTLLMTSNWSRDSFATARVLFDHFWMGCGLGSLADLWPIYRTSPSASPPAGSSMLAMAAETGVIFAAVVLFVSVLAFRRWRRVAPVLTSETRLVLAGIGAGLTGWFAMGVLGPGADAPPVLLVAAAFLGCLIRGLSCDVRLSEALTRT